MKLLVALSAVLCLLFGLGAVSGQGINLEPSSVCADIINYNVTVMGANDCQATQESTVISISTTLGLSGLSSTYVPIFSNPCRAAFMRLFCAVTYLPENSATMGAVPESFCDDVNALCSSTEITVFNTATMDAFTGASVACNALVPNSLFPVTIANTSRTPSCVSAASAVVPGSFCDGVVDYNVFMPAVTEFPPSSGNVLPTVAYFPTIAGALNGAYVTGNLSPVGFCRDNNVKAVCGTAYPRCGAGNAGGVFLTLPSFVDNALCQATLNSSLCGQFVLPVAQGLGITGCDATTTSFECSGASGRGNATSFLPFFPDGSTVIPGVGVSIASNPFTGAVDFQPICPAPLGVNPARGLTIGRLPDGTPLVSSCALPCPQYFYTEEEYRTSDELTLTLSGISLVMSSMMLSTYLLFKRTRRNIYNIYFTAALWLIAVALFFSWASQQTDDVPGIFPKMRCENPTTPAYDGYCYWQAVTLVYGAMAAVTFWFVQALDLYLQIAHGATKWTRSWKKAKTVAFYIWGFIVPGIFTVVCMARGELGNAHVGVPYCLITDSELSWWVFYGPIAAQCVLGVYFMFVIMKCIFQSSSATGKRKKGWWRIYTRPILFVVGFLFVWAFIFGYRFNENFNEARYISETGAFASALLQNPQCVSTNPVVRAACDATLPPPARPDLGLFYMIQIVTSSVGIIGFLLYNTNENMTMWYHFLLCKPYNFSRTTGDGGSTGSFSEDARSSRRGGRSPRQTTRRAKNASGVSSQGDTAETSA